MNALTLLKQDHNNVDDLFERFEHAGEDAAEKREIVDKVIEHLAVHAAIEEQVFYPALRAAIPDLSAEVLEGLEEHHIVKWVLSELEKMSPTDERFEAKVIVLIENVRHHIKEEEDDMFPRVREALTVEQLNEMGDALETAKKTAPTRPHPRTPDTPPLNVIVGQAAAAVDRLATTGRERVERLLHPPRH